MALRGMLFHQQLLLGLMILAATAANQDSQPNSSCSTYCGSLCIPYPFETRWGHFLDDSFYINCDNTSGTPKPTLGHDNNLEILNISLDGELRVSSPVTRRCNDSYYHQYVGSKFPISYKKNNLIGVGSYSVSYIYGGEPGKRYGTGCVSLSSGPFDGPGRDSRMILMSAKLQNPASMLIPAKTLLGVLNARVRRGSKAMA
ncbi:putative wall-associated receptor kinase-like 16 [Fagus crenata]